MCEFPVYNTVMKKFLYCDGTYFHDIPWIEFSQYKNSI